MQQDDILSVANMHMNAFPNFFLTKMGFDFIYFYYTNALSYYKSICLVAIDKDDKSIIGFVTGFQDASMFYQMLRANKRIYLLCIQSIIRNPLLTYAILRNQMRIGNKQQRQSSDIELSSIATDYKKRGVGSRLITSFIEAAKCMQTSNIYLTTDAHQNKSARLFYEKHGFIIEKYEIRRKRILCQYIKCIS